MYSSVTHQQMPLEDEFEHLQNIENELYDSPDDIYDHFDGDELYIDDKDNDIEYEKVVSDDESKM